MVSVTVLIRPAVALCPIVLRILQLTGAHRTLPDHVVALVVAQASSARPASPIGIIDELVAHTPSTFGTGFTLSFVNTRTRGLPWPPTSARTLTLQAAAWIPPAPPPNFPLRRALPGPGGIGSRIQTDF